jgi:hypothetical protein
MTPTIRFSCLRFISIKVLKNTIGQALQLGFNKHSNIKISGKLLQKIY